ncbi:MAG: copper homeostasis protein CutC [Acidobacteriota bacterium]
MASLLLEVIVQTVADAAAAALGGADRLEIVRDIRQGGLTPSLALVRAIAAATRLPLRVMVRDNDGYRLGADELPGLRRAAAQFAEAGVDGLVIGFATGGRPDPDAVSRVLAAAPGVRATFHRAFDVLDDPAAAIPDIARISGVDRILTGGGEGPADVRCRRLAEYSRLAAAPGLRIIAGGGVDEAALALFAREGCVGEVHVGRAARDDGEPDSPVSAARVRRLKSLLRVPPLT